MLLENTLKVINQVITEVIENLPTRQICQISIRIQ